MNEGLFIIALVCLSGYLLYNRLESHIESGRLNTIVDTIIKSSDENILALRNEVSKLTHRLKLLEGN